MSPVAPLAMAQNMEEINNIMQFMQITAQFGAEGLMAVKTGDLIDYIGDKLGIPSAIRNTGAERAFMMEEQKKMEIEQQVTMAMAGQQEALMKQQGAPLAA